MPRLIKNAAIVENQWLAVTAENDSGEARQILSLEQWEALESKADSAVQLEPGQTPAPLLDHLEELALVAINFPAFADGRGFSYARELRERGYQGEIRAVGHFIRDQLYYLKRCGFDAFQLDDEALLDGALSSLNEFSESYQAAIDQPQPLFRRR
jgi:uncharacterized protein (DUF934 family)